MPLPRIIPALADLTQDIAGPLPVELLQSWAGGSRDAAEAGRLLDSYRIDGTVVSSNASGLSRMTQERDLLEVLSIVSRPKQIVHSIGVAIGGRGIGIWVADNTEMYYPPGIAPSLVVDAMAEAQARIGSSAHVRLGMCVHGGEFFEIGGGLYGGDAETVEYLAEEHARAGEILVTKAVTSRIADAADGSFALQPDLGSVYPPGVYAVAGRPRMPDLRGEDRRYPHPYPEAFFSLLDQLGHGGASDETRRKIYDAYLRERVVVFVVREHEQVAAHSLTILLDEFVGNALMETVIRVTMRADDHIAGLGSGLAILTFDTPAEALAFAKAVRAQFATNGVPVRIGIDQGPVLFFPNPRGPSGIAGAPVNIASKLSEDAGSSGTIRITARAAQQMALPPGARAFQVTVSGIRLTGVEV